MPGKICYLGDDHLQGAAAYLAGVMLHEGLAHDHVPSAAAPPADFDAEPYALYVVSDYPAARFGAAAMEHVVRRVEQGAGLLMLGGWESFHGRLGEYHRSPLADALPVTMENADDRRNSAQPCLIEKVADHPVLADLPWDRPPGIGGYNAVTPKPGSHTLLRAVRFRVRRAADRFDFERESAAPLLVVGNHGRGRTVALATDAAPHWVGGFVDWGDGRVVQDVAEGFIEVGNWYARFFRNLLVWTGNL
ncbi:MAG: glutamine amidotransferase [Planctomycetaceae bacterium]